MSWTRRYAADRTVIRIQSHHRHSEPDELVPDYDTLRTIEQLQTSRVLSSRRFRSTLDLSFTIYSFVDIYPSPDQTSLASLISNLGSAPSFGLGSVVLKILNYNNIKTLQLQLEGMYCEVLDSALQLVCKPDMPCHGRSSVVLATALAVLH